MVEVETYWVIFCNKAYRMNAEIHIANKPIDVYHRINECDSPSCEGFHHVAMIMERHIEEREECMQ